MNTVAGVDNSATAAFARTRKGELGYSPKQVEKFLLAARNYLADPSEPPVSSKEVRVVSFDAVSGGLDADEVDAALDRLEDALARRERDALIRESGEQEWLKGIAALAEVLLSRLARADGERFRRPARDSTPGYDVDDVDRLCRRLQDYLERDAQIGIAEVRTAHFRTVKNREGYEEGQVDAFLDRVVELMSSIS